MNNCARLLLAVTVLVEALGAGAALLIARRSWQTIRTPVPPRVDVLDVSGRSVDSASTALALVALAGVVAVLATRGIARRAVGVIVALAGAGLVWRAIASSGPVGTGRARALVESAHRTVSAAGVVPRVSTHAIWPVLSGFTGLVVILTGLAIAWRGHRWQVMSARYEAPGDARDSDAGGAGPAASGRAGTAEEPEQARARAATALWSALDRGEDPTR